MRRLTDMKRVGFVAVSDFFLLTYEKKTKKLVV